MIKSTIKHLKLSALFIIGASIMLWEILTEERDLF